ncbi:MAG: sialate O-acetylesterase [Acidobacteria bacterium]|nr:sialate O-acetylesterase [Acidobacteriota bacterium]
MLRVLALAAVPLFAISNHQVIQRTSATGATVTIPCKGALRVSVSGTRTSVACGPDGSAKLDIPTGGPYRIEISGGAAITADDVYAGDLWLLAGQSNMVGRANLENIQQPDPKVHILRPRAGWEIAREPVHEQRMGFKGVMVGAGLGLPFAKEMVRRTGVPIGLIPTAVGGTSLWEWHPDLIQPGSRNFYAPMLEQFRAAGGRIKGVLWYQGEADCRDDRAPQYLAQFQSFIARVRTDFGDPRLPFYFVQLGRSSNEEPPPRNERGWNAVREAQRQAELTVPHTGMVTAIDLELEDAVHINTEGLRQTGRRLALVACRNLFPQACPDVKTGPRYESAAWDSDRRLRIRFSGVNGALTTQGRLLGFGIYDEEQRLRRVIYRNWIPAAPGNEVIIEVNHQWPVPQPLFLRYGEGMDPPANLRDQAGMAAPAFGPVPLPPRPPAVSEPKRD